METIIERRDAAGPLSVPSAGASTTSSKGTISGYGSVFYNGKPETEYQLAPNIVERIDPKAFDRALRERDDVAALFNHDGNIILGRRSAGTLQLSVDSIGLRYSIKTDANSPNHRNVIQAIRRRDVHGSSFMFATTDEAWTKENGVTVRTVKSISRLYDVGPVVFPAYTGSTSEYGGDAPRALLLPTFHGVDDDDLDDIRRNPLPGSLLAMHFAAQAAADGDLDQRRRRLRLAMVG